MRLRATGIDDSGDLDVDVDGIVFDKDGTLIDLDATWAPITAAMLDAVVVEAVGASASDDAIEQLRSIVRAAAGVNDDGSLVPNGPAAVEPLAVLAMAVGDAVADAGLEAPQALARLAVGAVPLDAVELVPLGEVDGTLRRLCDAGLLLGVATSDQRDLTEWSLDRLGWRELLPFVACGDDPVGPKPNPAVLHLLAAEMGTTADRLVMVGDSIGDVRTGQAAGCAATVGVVGSGGRPDGADVVIETIEAFFVDESPAGASESAS